jgi:hypothetical protein
MSAISRRDLVGSRTCSTLARSASLPFFNTIREYIEGKKGKISPLPGRESARPQAARAGFRGEVAADRPHTNGDRRSSPLPRHRTIALGRIRPPSKTYVEVQPRLTTDASFFDNSVHGWRILVVSHRAGAHRSSASSKPTEIRRAIGIAGPPAPRVDEDVRRSVNTASSSAPGR